MSAYYNEIDPQKAAWLGELVRRNIVSPGEVDERSIKEVQPEDLRGFAQCHFFAGIGVWSYALRLAGWPDNRSVWTGSCPCPSFSTAGKGGGFDDPRHLWPDWSRLVRKCKPAEIFGEQADDAIGYGWLDLVQTDLERENYAVGKAVLGACSVGAPHIRQRLYIVAHAETAEEITRSSEVYSGTGTDYANGFGNSSDAGRMEHSHIERCGEARNSGSGSGPGGKRPFGDVGDSQCDGRHQSTKDLRGGKSIISDASEEIGMGNASVPRLSERERNGRVQQREIFAPAREAVERGSYVNGFWRDADWILRKRWNSENWEWCPAEPGTFPLAAGTPARVLRLRGYGDSICAPLAAEFIRSYLETQTGE